MNIPKYIERLLERRRKLAYALIDINVRIVKYCERIGVGFEEYDEACICSSFMIYTEPDAAYDATRRAIEKQIEGDRKNG